MEKSDTNIEDPPPPPPPKKKKNNNNNNNKILKNVSYEIYFYLFCSSQIYII